MTFDVLTFSAMTAGGAVAVLLAALLAALLSPAPVRAGASSPATGAPGEAVAFAALPGFADDDHVAALRAFRESCAALAARTSPLRAALPAPAPLASACANAAALDPGEPAARAFFEANFTARRVSGADGTAFFTGYYEPVVDGSLTRTDVFATPLYGRPVELVDAPTGAPGLEPGLTAARRSADGRLVPMPDRSAIEAGALGAGAVPLVWLREPVDAFFVAVQGSARVRLPDGSLRRLAYAGRNGYPYTSIGKVLVDTLHVPPDAMGMGPLRAWIVANGQGPGEAGARLMQRNRSYIFFAFDDALPPEAGPVGGQGVSLTPGRSLAVDRSLWPYGLPFYVDAALPSESGAATPFRRLLVGQDTGSAILGRARGDIFFGTGPEAARRAGPVRAHGTLFVLWPKDSPEAGPKDVAKNTSKEIARGASKGAEADVLPGAPGSGQARQQARQQAVSKP